jgi:hypothetical protein
VNLGGGGLNYCYPYLFQISNKPELGLPITETIKYLIAKVIEIGRAELDNKSFVTFN